jgi:2,4-dienoyl-CoA reductase-like NADH-dependent reductase (Old Yellow Enzyme family)
MNGVLFQPFRLHELTLPNRVVLAPMTRGSAAAARLPNRLMAEYYAQRSSAGLLITEATTISEEANGWPGRATRISRPTHGRPLRVKTLGNSTKPSHARFRKETSHVQHIDLANPQPSRCLR